MGGGPPFFTPSASPAGYRLFHDLGCAISCHSERSEESRISKNLRSFTLFRMTEKLGFPIASIVMIHKLYGKKLAIS
jgi:hypothetical protein